MKLNLRQIEVFRAVMLSGSISGAAKLLFVSQPAVSRLLSYTEQRLGLQLFDRIKGRLHPTPEARLLFREVGTVYQGVQRVNEMAENLAHKRMGQLRIASSPNLGLALMPQAIALFCQRYPDVRVILHTLLPHMMLQSLLTYQVELGVSFMPVGHPSLLALDLCQNPIVAIFPPTHRLAGRPNIDISELADEPLIGYGSDIPFGQLIAEMFGEMPARTPRVEVQQAHVAWAMVQAGVGVALVDAMTGNAAALEGLASVPVMPKTHAPIRIFHLQIEPLSLLAQEFISILQSLGLQTGASHRQEATRM